MTKDESVQRIDELWYEDGEGLECYLDEEGEQGMIGMVSGWKWSSIKDWDGISMEKV